MNFLMILKPYFLQILKYSTVGMHLRHWCATNESVEWRSSKNKKQEMNISCVLAKTFSHEKNVRVVGRVVRIGETVQRSGLRGWSSFTILQTSNYVQNYYHVSCRLFSSIFSCGNSVMIGVSWFFYANVLSINAVDYLIDVFVITGYRLECIVIAQTISEASDSMVCCDDAFASFGTVFFVVMNRLKWSCYRSLFAQYCTCMNCSCSIYSFDGMK